MYAVCSERYAKYASRPASVTKIPRVLCVISALSLLYCCVLALLCHLPVCCVACGFTLLRCLIYIYVYHMCHM